MSALYDEVGGSYAAYRRPDARIAQKINRAIEATWSIVNVGAGTGSYEPADRAIVAVEPSATMIRQRNRRSVSVVQAVAEHLPFAAKSFDAAMAILTVHHWLDREAGIEELIRVARRRCVILTWEPLPQPSWLTRDYFPEILDRDITQFPPADDYRRFFGSLSISKVMIPHDCTDGFLESYWRRPHAYLDAAARSAISSFAYVKRLDDGLNRLGRDLEDGTWLRRNGHLFELDELDLGYRLITASLD